MAILQNDRKFYKIAMVFQIMPYKVVVHGLSDVGLVRQNNEDYWAQVPDESFYVLADGMGGHQAGEIASREAVEHLCALFKQLTINQKSLEGMQAALAEAVKHVNEIVYLMSQGNERLKGMGTTLCCLCVHSEGLICAHVGDSRIYLLRNQQLEQLTSDHSLLRELIDLGQINEKQAGDFHYKNIITKAIGTEPYVEPTVRSQPAEVGDTILMCTDGLTDLLSDEEIRTIMINSSEKDVAKKLIKSAKEKGGYDNITVVIVNIQEKYDKATDLSRS